MPFAIKVFFLGPASSLSWTPIQDLGRREEGENITKALRNDPLLSHASAKRFYYII